MPKFVKGKKKYNLLSSFGQEEYGQGYTASKSLYAWYQFNKNLKPLNTSTGITKNTLTDLSRNGRDLQPDADETGDSNWRTDHPQPPQFQEEFHSAPLGFPRNSSKFTLDTLNHQDETEFSFADGGSSDKPFSMSFWVRFNNAVGSYEFLASKWGTSTVTHAEWVVFRTNTGKLQFNVYDVDGHSSTITSTTNVLKVPRKWHHVVVTYTGAYTSGAMTGAKMYLDGTLLTVSTSGGSYDGMTSKNTTMLTIGNRDPESNSYDLNADLLEAAFWNTALSSSDIEALYNYPKLTSHYKSGYVTNPPKTIIHELDNQLGKYPTNTRTGDPDFLGKQKISFDDTNTIEFRSPFARAKIDLGDVFSDTEYETLFGAAIGLTSSDGNNKVAFQWLPSTKKEGSFIHNTSDFAPAVSSTDIAVRINHLDLSQNNKSFFAKSLVEEINKYSTDLGMVASRTGNTINLVRLEPNIGLNKVSIVTVPQVPIEQIESTDFHTTLSSQGISALLLDQTTKFKNKNLKLASPNILPDIKSYLNIIPGVSDSDIIIENNFEPISPFNEANVTIDSHTTFFVSGTDPKILPGFSTPTRSKTSLTFNLESSNGLGTHIFFSTGAKGEYHGAIQNTQGSGMAYWNSSRKVWEMLTSSAIDVFAYNQSDRAQACMGFSAPEGNLPEFTYNSNNQTTLKRRIQMSKQAGEPISNFGFPSAGQYNATSSQCYKMSDHISSPFLLEKIKVHFEGNLGIRATLATTSPVCQRIFFILAQKTDPDNPHTAENFVVTQNRQTATDALEVSSHKITSKGTRELVAYSKIGTVRKGHRIFASASVTDQQDFLSDYGKIIEVSTQDITNKGVSGSFSFNAYPRLSLSNKATFLHWSRRTSSNNNFASPASSNRLITQVSNDLGGADLRGNVSGRQLSISLDHADINNEFTASTVTNLPKIHPRTENSKISPYVLLPEDTLIFGWQNHPIPNTNEAVPAEQEVDRISKMRITLFGSLIRDSSEFHDTQNQALTSHAIHESIFGEPDTDQFDVEPLGILSGSTFDSLMVGKLVSTDRDGNIVVGNRGRRGSIARGDAGSTGSLSRNIHLVDGSAKYADTQQPPAWFLMQAFMGAAAATGSSSTAGYFKPNFVTGSAPFAGLERNYLQLSPKLQVNMPNGSLVSNKSRLLLGSLGVCNIKNFNLQKTAQVSTSPFTPPGGGLLLNSPAFNIAIDMSTDIHATSALMIFSGSKEEAIGVNSKFDHQIAVSPKANPPTLRSPSGPSALAIASLMYGMPKLLHFGGGGMTFPVTTIKNKMTASVIPDVRGFKYGIMNCVPTAPTYSFRRNKYGQFRDIIETPPEAAFENGNFTSAFGAKSIGGIETVESPIKIVFVSRSGDSNIDPLDTNTQNLSHAATSSVPYIDGHSLDRNVLVDPPPDMTDVTTLEEKVDQILDGDA